MKNFVLRDLVFILVIYIVYFAVTWIVAMLAGAPEEAWGEQSLVVLFASLLCTVVWYGVGEWIMRPSTSKGSWYGFWFLLLVVVLGTALLIVILEPLPDVSVEAVFFVGGAGAYYLATMLFSPFHGKYLIWPSMHVRTW
ncbi:MAG TPA: hypothetical protein VK670_04790 [Silvibacterium sp.]|nr:hypothetical protein [Silvibacterium sp.]